jgi:hypothetical protein
MTAGNSPTSTRTSKNYQAPLRTSQYPHVNNVFFHCCRDNDRLLLLLLHRLIRESIHISNIWLWSTNDRVKHEYERKIISKCLRMPILEYLESFSKFTLLKFKNIGRKFRTKMFSGRLLPKQNIFNFGIILSTRQYAQFCCVCK